MIDGVEIAAAVRAMPGERACGDRAVYWRDEDVLLVAVIDGLGHGPGAARASAAACAYIDAHRDEPLARVVEGCDRALRQTRGAVMTLIRVDPSRAILQHVAIGNVETRYRGNGDVCALTVPGVVGTRLRKVRERSFSVAPGDLFVVYTDGISSQFDLAALAHLPAQELADQLLRTHAKDHDDAGCAVIRC